MWPGGCNRDQTVATRRKTWSALYLALVAVGAFPIGIELTNRSGLGAEDSLAEKAVDALRHVDVQIPLRNEAVFRLL